MTQWHLAFTKLDEVPDSSTIYNFFGIQYYTLTIHRIFQIFGERFFKRLLNLEYENNIKNIVALLLMIKQMVSEPPATGPSLLFIYFATEADSFIWISCWNQQEWSS